MRTADEKPVLRASAKTEIRHAVRYQNFAEQMAFRINAMDAIGGARPYVSVFIDAHAIAITGLDRVENPAACKAPAVLCNIEDPDEPRRLLLRLIARLGDLRIKGRRRT